MKYINDYYPELVQFLMDGETMSQPKVYIVNNSEEQHGLKLSESDPDWTPSLKSFFCNGIEVKYIPNDSWMLLGIENPNSDAISEKWDERQDIIKDFSISKSTCLVIPILNLIHRFGRNQTEDLRLACFWRPVNKLLSLMVQDAKLLIPVPIRFLKATESSVLRHELFMDHRALIIEHNHPYSGIRFGLDCDYERDRVATIVLWKIPGAKTFFRIQQEDANDFNSVKKRLRVLLKNSDKTVKGGFSIVNGLVAHYPTLQDYYDPTIIGKKPEDFPKLSDFSKIFQGDILKDEESGSDLSFLTRDCITVEQVIDMTKSLTVRSARQRTLLKSGDLCLIAQTDAKGNLLVAPATGLRGKMTFDSSLILIRFNQGEPDERKEFVLSFLRSPAAARFMYPDGIFPDHDIDPALLGELPIPLNEEVEAVHAEIHKAKADFENWAIEAQSAINSLLVEDETSGIRERILMAGKECRRMHQAAKRTQILDYRIITQYPRPLSFVWSEYKASIRDNRDACFESMAKIKKAGETLVAFIALIAASHVRHLGGDAFSGCRLSKSKNGKKSFDFGTWESILANAFAGISGKPTDHTIPDWTSLSKDEDWKKAVNKLRDIRNADAHLRIPHADLVNQVQEAETHLEILFERVGFLTNFSFRVADTVRLDSLAKISTVEFREIHGASVYNVSETARVESDLVESGSLYLVNRIGKPRWHLLRPLLQLRKCHQYKIDSVFILDSVCGDKPNDLVLRSFEFNSTQSTSENNEVFKKAGMFKDEI